MDGPGYIKISYSVIQKKQMTNFRIKLPEKIRVIFFTSWGCRHHLHIPQGHLHWKSFYQECLGCSPTLAIFSAFSLSCECILKRRSNILCEVFISRIFGLCTCAVRHHLLSTFSISMESSPSLETGGSLVFGLLLRTLSFWGYRCKSNSSLFSSDSGSSIPVIRHQLTLSPGRRLEMDLNSFSLPICSKHLYYEFIHLVSEEEHL